MEEWLITYLIPPKILLYRFLDICKTKNRIWKKNWKNRYESNFWKISKIFMKIIYCYFFTFFFNFDFSLSAHFWNYMCWYLKDSCVLRIESKFKFDLIFMHFGPLNLPKVAKITTKRENRQIKNFSVYFWIVKKIK